MSKYVLVVLCLCAVLVTAACGQEVSEIEANISTSQPLIERPSTSEPTIDPKVDSEDVEILEGSWTCVGIVRDGEMILLSDVPALADLYDQTLTINDDGTYAIFDIPYGERGSWISLKQFASEGLEHFYKFDKEYSIMYNFNDGVLGNTETESEGEAFVSIVETDNGNLLAWSDDGKTDYVIVYQKDLY